MTFRRRPGQHCGVHVLQHSEEEVCNPMGFLGLFGVESLGVGLGFGIPSSDFWVIKLGRVILPGMC